MLATAKVLGPSTVFNKLRTVKIALEKMDSHRRLNRFRIHQFRPRVSFAIERGSFLVKTAESGDELEECLKLRYQVFHREYKNKRRTIGVDVDALDLICDHLMIRDQSSGRIVGTYRLNSSRFNSQFYSAGEFDLGKLVDLPGHKLELGRACIDRSYRTGSVIALLWRGIAEYIQRTETRILFGCASVQTMNPMDIGLLTYHFARTGVLSNDDAVQPTRKYKVKQLAHILEYIDAHPIEYDSENVSKMVPALLQSYLRMGARLCGEPALDRDFKCIDFLICLKLDELHPLLKSKYKV